MSSAMDESKTTFIELLNSALSRAAERTWSTETEQVTLTADDAIGAVAQVFENQLVGQMTAKTQGAEFFVGVLSLEHVFSSIPPTENEILHAIDRSSDDYYTFQALRILARLRIPPDSVALKRWSDDLISGVVKEPSLPKGPSACRDAHRNMLIVSQLKELNRAGFGPTRNAQRSSDSLTGSSGCDIVAVALGRIGHAMSYEAVERVWKKRDKQPKPEHFAKLLLKATRSSQDG